MLEAQRPLKNRATGVPSRDTVPPLRRRVIESGWGRVWLMCPCTWVRCCLVFSVLFGGLLGDRE
eukprot:scaffold98419_cov64-Phaeocystis_antarctica.AAC.1